LFSLFALLPFLKNRLFPQSVPQFSLFCWWVFTRLDSGGVCLLPIMVFLPTVPQSTPWPHPAPLLMLLQLTGDFSRWRQFEQQHRICEVRSSPPSLRFCLFSFCFVLTSFIFLNFHSPIGPLSLVSTGLRTGWCINHFA